MALNLKSIPDDNGSVGGLRPFGRNDSIRNHIVQVFGGVG
jgi:hypothetical protein